MTFEVGDKVYIVRGTYGDQSATVIEDLSDLDPGFYAVRLASGAIRTFGTEHMI